ncbi:DUF4179 domain-containing protein [Clostridium sp. 'White wine YQ']|uniref:DUF4179 domain-containing protein n=1 Tax=Clostridium sp. 'White wine YQ' TaxID=3027474 RepID=UPI0023652E54|nr:DUF4179 domain-containing protein [Clostridium sp. 'White wine YQ']MDD7794177.1 DUF4179 domain-containing protein [Clostridium sp. 'White wine YQ']
MSDFDEIIKKNINNEKWAVPKNFDNKICTLMQNLPDGSVKIKRKVNTQKFIAVACVLLVFIIGISFNSPSVKAAVNNVIGYFKGNNDSKFSGDEVRVEALNNPIGIAVKDEGIKFTVDNIDVDDNFIYVFYTVESDKEIEKKDSTDELSAFFNEANIKYKVDGRALEFGANDDCEAYFESDRVLKGMTKANISSVNLKDKFKLEILAESILGTKGTWKIETDVDKSKVAIDSKIIKPNITTNINFGDNINREITIDKVIISPLGNQVVITSDANIKDYLLYYFAITDDKGNYSTIFNRNINETSNGKTTITFEFLGVNKNSEYFNIVPIHFKFNSKDTPSEHLNIGKLPDTIKLSEYGSLTIEDIKFDKTHIKISYRKNGVVTPYNFFKFYDKNDKELEKPSGYNEEHLDRSTGIYTSTFYLNKDDNNDYSDYVKLYRTKDTDLKVFKDQAIKINLR